MSDKDYIKELFQKKLGNLETPVDPSLWAAVHAGIPASGSVGGLSLVAKLVIGISAASVVATVSYFTLFNEASTKDDQRSKPVEKVLSSEDLNKEDEQVSNTNELTAPSQSPVDNYLEAFSTENIAHPRSERESTVASSEEEVPVLEFMVKTPELPEFQKPIIEKEEESPIKELTIPSSEEGTDNETLSNEEIGEEQVEERLTLPNVFSPNGDGDNDFLFLKETELKDFQLVVLNKLNQVVFETTDPSFKWDGAGQNGNALPVGDYYYILTAYDENGKPIHSSSSLRIVR